MRYLITGASGFVGGYLCAELVKRGQSVRIASRLQQTTVPQIEQVLVGVIDDQTQWGMALEGVDVVIHLAARVHIMHDKSDDPLQAFRLVNVAGSENLARSAAAKGIKRLVYVSSIKVNGEATQANRLFSEEDEANPQDSYGLSKYEAEIALHQIAHETGLEVVVVRPPLVYGPAVKGNFITMLKVLYKGVPLPVASVRNLRSLLYVENLVDALILCASHPSAVGNTYLVSDEEDISTPELLNKLAAAMNRPIHLFSIPTYLLKSFARITGKSAQLERLLGSLQVDSDKIRRELNWTPPYTLQQGLQATAEWYRKTHL